MPSREICRFTIGTHEFVLSCCGGPGKCEAGGGVLEVSAPDPAEGPDGDTISTCLPFEHAVILRAGMNEMLLEMANTGNAEERSVKLRGELTALNLAVNKVREELRLA